MHLAPWLSGEPWLVFSPLYFLPEESQLLSKLSGDRVVYNTTRKIVVQASSVCNPRTSHKNKKDLLRRHALVLQLVSHLELERQGQSEQGNKIRRLGDERRRGGRPGRAGWWRTPGWRGTRPRRRIPWRCGGRLHLEGSSWLVKKISNFRKLNPISMLVMRRCSTSETYRSADSRLTIYIHTWNFRRAKVQWILMNMHIRNL